MIVVMLRSSPQQRQQSTADSSSSGHLLHTSTSEAHYRTRASPSAGFIAKAYAKFLELPVAVVLAVLWLFGALLLGMVMMAALTLL